MEGYNAGHAGNAMAKQSGGEKVSAGPLGQVVRYATQLLLSYLFGTLVIRGRYVPVWAMAFLRPNRLPRVSVFDSETGAQHFHRRVRVDAN